MYKLDVQNVYRIVKVYKHQILIFNKKTCRWEGEFWQRISRKVQGIHEGAGIQAQRWKVRQESLAWAHTEAGLSWPWRKREKLIMVCIFAQCLCSWCTWVWISSTQYAIWYISTRTRIFNTNTRNMPVFKRIAIAFSMI